MPTLPSRMTVIAIRAPGGPKMLVPEEVITTLRPRSVPEKAAIARGIEEQVWPLVVAGRIKPVIDSTFPLAQAASAHARMETSQHIGKIVLTV